MYSRKYVDQYLCAFWRYPAPWTKTTAGFFGSRFAPIISGVNSRAYTSAPSRAVYVMILGSIHLNARHSSIGLVVTWMSDVPGRNGATYNSGGLLLYEYTTASVFSSGDTV